ncbi:MAG: efflux RND transporter periplasmic adaptor subunit [Bacteroidetes bacterium]|nr:efflux RND transporter periplasmic adaptor subunit [Bacteroidota bacterium]
MKYIQFIFVSCAAVALSACGENKANTNKPVATAAAHYDIAKVEKEPLQQTVRLPAQLSAYEEVSIFPKVNGYVKQVTVDIGSHVKQGQLLMVLDAPELLQAAMQAREKYMRAKADCALAIENYTRLKQAAATPGAVSMIDLAAARSRMEADSAICNAEKASWEMQQTMIGYLNVTAPFGGVITERNVHPGALVSAAGKDSKPMLELKQLLRLRLQVDVPEAYASSLRGKDTVSFFLSAWPGRKFTGHINRQSMNMNMQYRTERVEIDVPNDKEELSPGMYADVLLSSRGNADAFVVPKSAVITSTERKYVILVKNGMAMKTDVSTGNQTADKVEVFGNMAAGDEVLTNPTDEIRDGAKLR